MRVLTLVVDEAITLEGDSIWGGAEGVVRVTKVEVEASTKEDLYDEGDEDAAEEDKGFISVYVTHDRTWDIYTDSGFEEGVAALIRRLTGQAVEDGVGFTEQGEQEDGLAFMEGDDDALAAYVLEHGKDVDDNAHVTRLQQFLRDAVETDDDKED